LNEEKTREALQELTKIAVDKGGSMTMHEIKNEQGEVVHGFATMSLPLRKDHWIYQKGDDGYGFPPPMPLRVGSEGEVSITITEADPAKNPGWVGSRTIILSRRQMAEMIRSAGKYAVRSATMHGSEMDFDPDAMLQNLCVGFLGYWTVNGFGGEPWDDPKAPWTPGPPPAEPIGSDGNSTVEPNSAAQQT
jgi:hypothetical protein